MFDQVAKRDFVVRRGRNNRLLVRSILKNVFEEKQDEIAKILDKKKVQSYFLDNYNKIWLGKRPRE